MATASIYFSVQAASGNQAHVFPSAGLGTPFTRTFGSGIMAVKYFLVSSTPITLFDASATGPDMADFDLLVVLSNQDIWLEWELASVSDAGDRASVKVPANVPFILPVSSSGMLDGNNPSSIVAGTIDKVNAVRVSSDANVEVFAIT